jgi:hypothetical protein
MKIRYSFIPVCITIFISAAFAGDPPALRRTLLDEVRRHPQLQMQDLYKFAYQAAMGNEHIMADSAEMEKYLCQELAGITPGGPEDLVEYLTPDSSAVRVNLRPFKKLNGNAVKLVSLMIKSTRVFKPSREKLRIYLAGIEKLAEDGLIPFKAESIRTYFKQLEEKQFPAMHHSKIFEETYKPAYRVIAGCYVSDIH